VTVHQLTRNSDHKISYYKHYDNCFPPAQYQSVCVISGGIL